MREIHHKHTHKHIVATEWTSGGRFRFFNPLPSWSLLIKSLNSVQRMACNLGVHFLQLLPRHWRLLCLHLLVCLHCALSRSFCGGNTGQTICQLIHFALGTGLSLLMLLPDLSSWQPCHSFLRRRLSHGSGQNSLCQRPKLTNILLTCTGGKEHCKKKQRNQRDSNTIIT